MRRWFGFACIALAALSFGLCLTSLIDRPAVAQHGTYSWDRLDLPLYRATPTYPQLLGYARSHVKGSGEQKAIELLDIVSRRFAHGDSEENLLSSYPAALAGLVNPAFSTTFARDRILRAGDRGLCSQQSYILIQLANDLGMRARQVGLNGHVVAEVWYDKDWHMLDPDYEVYVRNGAGEIAGVRQLIADPALLKAAYAAKNPVIPALYESRQDNNFISYPQGAYFEWKSNALVYVTTVLDATKWFFPPLLLLAGLLLLRRRRRIDGPATSAAADR